MAQDKFNNYMVIFRDVGDDDGVVMLFNNPTYKKARKLARKLCGKLEGASAELFEYNGDINLPYDPANVGEMLWDNLPKD